MNRDRFFILFGLGESRYSWAGVWLLAGLYGGALLFAAVAAPPCYEMVRAWAAESSARWLDYLAGKPLHDYFDRLRWFPVLVGLPLLFRKCGLWSFRRLGFEAEGAAGRVVRWWGLGVVSLLPLTLGQLAAGVSRWRLDLSPDRVAGALAAAVVAAAVVSLLEETVFRGLVFRFFYTAVSPVAAVLAASLFFAYAHFKFPDALAAGGEAGWGAGFYVMAWTVAGVAVDFEPLAFLNLTLTGAVLALVFLRTRSLWSCVGLHAGWVSIISTQRKLLAAESESLWLGSTRVTDGLLATLLLVAVGLWQAARLRGGAVEPEGARDSAAG